MLNTHFRNTKLLCNVLQGLRNRYFFASILSVRAINAGMATGTSTKATINNERIGYLTETATAFPQN
ncbi:hypothetical protein Awo_c33860 [Acetobacterium woodii DSM 1030]|uniref:Uncharacterized protein n=1 Tax=Acetobacterium woodii (strain ATCC 29683 / DSM 1030 / JCM 2381 / KCTC 1655 / WB1) TaxID=931626 RepID=H6LL05_ACEWD|nr:hypothetical protein Awo_c33860 [Acetobacterium woodii DSM 1030]